jgi:hypothetical protein
MLHCNIESLGAKVTEQLVIFTLTTGELIC